MDPPTGVYFHHSPDENTPNRTPLDTNPAPPASHASSSSSTITQSTASSSGELPLAPPKKRARISKACQHCRKKKVKCDGGKPCNNCVQSNGGNCVYEEDAEKKPKPPSKKKSSTPSKTKLSKTQTIKELDERLLRIETMLSDLTTELQAMRAKPHNVSDSTLSEITEESEPDESGADSEIESNLLRAYAVTNVFSKESLKEMFAPIGGNEAKRYLEDISNVGAIYNYYSQAFLDTVCQPIKIRLRKRFELMDSIFADASLPVEILNTYYDRIFFLKLVLERKYITGLFDKYYQEKDVPNRSIFTWSELLIMSSTIGISVSLILDERNLGKKSSSEMINSLSDAQLIEINSKCFYSMVLYYNRLCYVSEGITSVQALVFWVIYLESIISSLRVNVVPITIAVKYAEDLGLHLHETYEGLSWDEQLVRKTLWWFCEFYLIEYNTRSGHPAGLTLEEVISLEDVSSNAVIKSNWNLLESYFKSPNDASVLAKIRESNATHRCVAYVMYCVSKIRIKSFDLLYKSNCKMTVSQLINNLELLNDEMKSINNAPLSFKFYDDDDFMFHSKKSIALVQKLDNGYENYFFLNLVYFQHLMTINRIKVPQTTAQKYLDKVSEFTKIANKSARTILHVTRSLKLQDLAFTTFSWILYYPYVAFLHLGGYCMEHPHYNGIEEDLKLLINVSLLFFPYKLDPKTAPVRRNCVRQLFYDLVTRYVLNVIIKLIDVELSKKLLKKHKTLKAHLNMMSNFPEFFIDNVHIGINKAHTNQVLRKWFSPYELSRSSISQSNSVTTPVSTPETRNTTSAPTISANNHGVQSNSHSASTENSNSNNRNNTTSYQHPQPLGLPPQQQYNEFAAEFPESSSSSIQHMFRFPLPGPVPSAPPPFNGEQFSPETMMGNHSVQGQPGQPPPPPPPPPPPQRTQSQLAANHTPMNITPQLQPGHPQPTPPGQPNMHGSLPPDNMFNHSINGLNTNFISFEEVEDYANTFFNPNNDNSGQPQQQQQQQQQPP
ncbi:Thiamine repressible genes regulatory protein thi1 [Candida viswanathii]|uniref:Thiamine repressible genes regulatory protein thi1 n=1 Tax=Candida viswanathii TaxID=5486 RepID=A0A367YHG2_9ASCO|nr:Thiamine repressible genes regulatory protein thi1 [Candida viswanathii]